MAVHLQSAQHGAGHDERRATPLRAKALDKRGCCPRGFLLPFVGERRVVHTLGQPNGCGLTDWKALVAHAALNLELNKVVGALTLQKFSNVSALVHLRYEATIETTCENVHTMPHDDQVQALLSGFGAEPERTARRGQRTHIF
jgi:hypothetical protein